MAVQPSGAAGAPALDVESRRWIADLRSAGPRREEGVRRLHALLFRAARREAARRLARSGAAGAPDLDVVAHQAADDAVMSILDRLDGFRGASRFTTWAYKFAMYEVSNKLARAARRRGDVALDEDAWDRLPDRAAVRPAGAAEQRELLAALRVAVDEHLTERQRRVFVSVALNDVPIDAVAAELASNRNAVYKTLHDARRKLRRALTEAGYEVAA